MSNGILVIRLQGMNMKYKYENSNSDNSQTTLAFSRKIDTKKLSEKSGNNLFFLRFNFCCLQPTKIATLYCCDISKRRLYVAYHFTHK